MVKTELHFLIYFKMKTSEDTPLNWFSRFINSVNFLLFVGSPKLHEEIAYNILNSDL
jgi:hypothetical protein